MRIVTSLAVMFTALATYGCIQTLYGPRAAWAASLFTGAEQYQNFNRMRDIVSASTMTPSAHPVDFASGESIQLPTSFQFEGEELGTEEFLVSTDTAAVLVLQDGKVRFERYTLTGGPNVQWLSMSVAKSFVSAAVGIAVNDGHISSIEVPITDYVPWLAGSAYDGVRIKDVLQMSSGARWTENYNDPDADIHRLAGVLAMGASLNEFLQGMASEREPGTYNQYNSADTQALGALLVAATGRTITDYMQEKLWHPLGMQNAGYWIQDDEGMELVFAGLNATARDYAKLGELYRNGGHFQGKQVVPESWVAASVVADAAHLQPGNNPNSDWPLGYGYQWWLLNGDRGEYSAIGVYNQFIYVHPEKRAVIVKLSANSDYGTTADGSLDAEFETFELFRAIVERL